MSHLDDDGAKRRIKNQIQFIIFNEIKDLSRKISAASWALSRGIRWTFIKVDTVFGVEFRCRDGFLSTLSLSLSRDETSVEGIYDHREPQPSTPRPPRREQETF